MIHALVLGLVIAIILIILIQKVTSGFTAAECDARYTLAYQACSDAYEKAQRGRATTSDKQKALRAKESCLDAAAAAKIICLGPAAAAGDVVATKRLQDAQRQDRKTSSQPTVTAANRVTPGAALTPSAPRVFRPAGLRPRSSLRSRPAPSQGNQGNRGGSAVPAPAQVLAVPVPAPAQVLAVPVPAPAEAPSALQMAPCEANETEMIFGGQLPGEGLMGEKAPLLRAGDPVCRKPLPIGQLCDIERNEIQHTITSNNKECLTLRR